MVQAGRTSAGRFGRPPGPPSSPAGTCRTGTGMSADKPGLLQNIVSSLREEFPGLTSSPHWILADSPGGTQAHQSVIDAISSSLSSPTANLGGSYPSALDTIQGLARAREVAATFLNCSSQEVTFGANMTTLTLHISRAIGRTLGPKDNVVVTNLDHDANVTPWKLAAEDKGAELRRVDFLTSTCLLDVGHLQKVLDSNTRVVALGAAANSCGSLTDIRAAVAMVRATSPSALVYVDAVHYAPHRLPDVQELGCDFFVCSAYKFCGPHAGLLYGRREVMENLEPYKLTACTSLLPSPASNQSSRWETGTASFEAISGIRAAIEYLATLGPRANREGEGLRARLEEGYRAVREHEEDISRLFLSSAATIPGLTVFGVTEIEQVHQRTPTFSMGLQGLSAPQLAQHLVNRGVACGAGHFYALNFPKLMGLEEQGGFTRVGFCHYHTLQEVRAVVSALQDIASLVAK